MVIKLYKNLSEDNKIGKTLSSEISLDGELKDSCNVLTPAVLITADDLTLYNYMYIPSFNRYYFITDIEATRRGLFLISGRVDVLETWKDNIKNLSAIISRNEKSYDMYLQDGAFKKEAYTQIATLEFPQGFNADNDFILLVSGGGQ